MQPAAWKDCAEHLGNDELQGVKMPYGLPSQNAAANASLQYNEVGRNFYSFIFTLSNR